MPGKVLADRAIPPLAQALDQRGREAADGVRIAVERAIADDAAVAVDRGRARA